MELGIKVAPVKDKRLGRKGEKLSRRPSFISQSREGRGRGEIRRHNLINIYVIQTPKNMKSVGK